MYIYININIYIYIYIYLYTCCFEVHQEATRRGPAGRGGVLRAADVHQDAHAGGGSTAEEQHHKYINK